LMVNGPNDAMEHLLRFYLFRLSVGLIMTITGNAFMKGGVGKSYAAIRVGEILDKDYRTGIEGMKKIIFTPDDFVRAVKLVEQKGIRGQVLIIDEAGIFINSRQWQSMINKAMNNILMTFRTLHCLAIFVAPSLSMIDKNARMFTNFWCIMEKKVVNGKLVYTMRPKKLVWDMYNKAERFWAKKIMMYNKSSGRVMEVERFVVSHPRNRELTDEYERVAAQYKVQQRAKIAEVGELYETDKIVEEVLVNPKLWSKRRDGKMRVSLADVKNWYPDMEKKELDFIVRSASKRLMEAEGSA